MREENKNVSKNGWKRIFGKKWFFPAAYLTIAALLLTGVLWYQGLDSEIPEASQTPQTDISNDEVSGQEGNYVDFNEDAVGVMEPTEVMLMPVADESQAKIVTKFYDYDADSEDQEKALVLYNNKYYQSKGVDISSADGETFDVTASLSGTVTEVKEDPLLGNVIKMTHDNDLSTYYASLENVLVEAGAEVKQGDTIGSAGRNIYGQASGVHVHFEVRKAGEAVNPEDFFNKPMTDIEEPENREENTDQSDGSEHANDAADEEDSEEDADPEEDGEGQEDSSEGEQQTTESSAAMANA